MKVAFWTVGVLVMVLRAVRLVMSPLTTEAAAPRLVKAPPAEVAPVPPLATWTVPDQLPVLRPTGLTRKYGAA